MKGWFTGAQLIWIRSSLASVEIEGRASPCRFAHKMDIIANTPRRPSYIEASDVSISVSGAGVFVEADGAWLPATVVQRSMLLQVHRTDVYLFIPLAFFVRRHTS
jgi:hypothetical protein